MWVLSPRHMDGAPTAGPHAALQWTADRILLPPRRTVVGIHYLHDCIRSRTCKSAQVMLLFCACAAPSASSSSCCAWLANRAGCQLNGDCKGTPHAAACCSVTRVSPVTPDGMRVHPSGCCGASAAAAAPQVCSSGSCCNCSVLLIGSRLWTTSRTCNSSSNTPGSVAPS